MKADADNIFGNANSYEGYVGRWSHFVAYPFVAWLDVAPGGDWLDVGAGTGILTQVILEEAAPTKIIGVDLSAEYIEFARQHVQDARVEFRVGDAAQLVTESPQFDAAVSGLVLNFVPSPDQVAQTMVQAVRGGGMVAAYVWDYGGKMEMMRHFWDAALVVDPSSHEMDSGHRFAICRPENLHTLFESVGLEAVDVMPIDIQTPFKHFDDYWLPFLGAQGSVAKYLHSLDDTTRNAIRDQLRQQLPTTEGGIIPLMARAWAVKGKKAQTA